MALRDMIADIVRPIVREVVQQMREESRVSAEITTGPNGEKRGSTNRHNWLKKVAASSTDETGPLWQAENHSVSGQIGTRVWFGEEWHEPGHRKILGVDYTDLSYQTNGDTFSTVSEHANIHEIDTNFNQPFQTHGRDALSLGVPNFKPLRTRPSAAGGVAVDVESYQYVYNGADVNFGGITNLSLSSAIPGANLQRFVAVYLDKSTNKIKTSNGSTVAINAGRPPDPTISDANIIISAYVRVYNGQTSISPTDDISDQRDLIGGAFKISNVPYQDVADSGQKTTDDDVPKSTKVQFAGGLVVGGNDGDSTVATATIIEDTSTAYADAVPATGDTALLLNNPADHVSGGVQTGILFRLQGDSVTRKAYIGAITEAATRDAALVFATDNGTTQPEAMRIDSDGNVGIGQTAPIDNLHVGPYSGGKTVSSGAGIYIGSNTGSGIAQLALEDQTGSVEGGIYAHTNGQMYFGSWTSSKINLRTNLTTALTIDTNQDVGIGTASPQGRFHATTANNLANYLVWEFDDLDTTTETVIANGTGDVTAILVYQSIVTDSGGTTQHNSGTIATSANADIFDDTTDVFNLRVNADGSVDVRRTAGAATADIALVLFWM